jgi:predicted ATPase/transcriptional regulator with XRE-family HTH domain
MSDPPGATTFGRLLRTHRLAAGLTQDALAELARISSRTIQELEAGSARPRRVTAVRLAEALELAAPDYDELVSASGPAPRRRGNRLSASAGGDVDRSDGRNNLAVARPEPSEVARDHPLVLFPRPALLPDHAPAALDTRSQGLPIQTTPLIGREQTEASLQALVLRDDVRLVTLTGPGGVGKTRVALQAAADVQDRFEHGACFVDLAPVSDPGRVVAAIAQALGLQDAARRALLDAVVDALRARHLLLVLDNFEQVLPAATDVDALLRACPRLTVLATSRAPLQLRAEHEFPVPPLSLPLAGQSLAPDALTGYAAVALFVERATAVSPDFAITAENALAIVEICVRLDGLPLAIELAAARTRLFPPRAMLARLERRLPLLADGPRDLPARQRTLRATMAWSYDLLSADEQRLFDRLGVFVGGCTLDAIETVAGDGAGGTIRLSPNPQPLHGGHFRYTDIPSPIIRHPAPVTLDLVAALVSRNLLRQQEQPDGEPRFSMLETIREYALERLEARGEAPEVRRRHAEHFMALAEEARPWLTRTESRVWFDRLETEHDNLRAALVWAEAFDSEVLARTVLPLWWFWYQHGHFGDLKRWLTLARDRATDPARYLELLFCTANLALFLDQAPKSIELFNQVIEIGRAQGNQRAVARALARRAYMMRNVSNMPQSVADAIEAVALARQIGDPLVLAHALHGRAEAARGEVNLDIAHASWSEALELYRKVGETYMVAHMLNNLGSIATQRGELDTALRLCSEALALIRQRDDTFALRPSLVNMIRLAHRMGDEERALTAAREVLILCAEQGTPMTGSLAIDGFAWVAIRRGEAVRAARLLGAAAGLWREAGYSNRAEQHDVKKDTEALVRAALGEEELAAAWAEGEAMSLSQVATYALQEPRAD